MKKMILLAGIITLSAAVLFTGCKKDEDPPPVGDPTIELVVEAGFIHTDATLPTGSEFKVKVRADRNATTLENLATLEISRTFTPTKSTMADTTYSYDLQNNPSIEVEFTTNANPELGMEDFDFKVIDAVGNSSSIGFTITTESNVEKFTGIILASWDDNAAGSFFATTTGDVIYKADGPANLDIIDFCFFQGGSNGTTYASVIDTDAQTVYGIDWDGNDTRFDKTNTITAAEFDAIGDSYVFTDFTGTDTKANQLSVDDVVYFKTEAGKRGYIRVNDVYERGFVSNIDVIVEK